MDEMLDKTVCAAYLSSCHKARGCPMQKGDGFFAEAVLPNATITYKGNHGVYAFIASDDDTKVAVKIRNTITKKEIDLKSSEFKNFSFPMDCVIEKNWDEWAAFLVILKRKVLVHTLFGKPKVKLEELTQDLDLFIQQFHKGYADNEVAVQNDVASAAKRRRKTPPPAAPVQPLTM